MQVATVAEIHRYPVKSMLGERLNAVSVGHDGLRGDRAWAVRDEGRRGIEGARKLPQLMGCAARFGETVAESGTLPVPEIELPDGTRLPADDPDAAKRLSDLTDRELTLWPRLPVDDEAHYRRGIPDNPDMLEELRSIFGRLPDEPLPDLSVFPPELFEFESPPGTYFDAYPLLMMSQASLDSMQARAPESRFDVRRFRPNLVIGETAAGSGFPERDWCGGRVRIGQAVIAVEIECPRCVMTTHGFEDLPEDPKVMRALVGEAGGNLGVYAKVETAGRIKVGDPVELL
jgi:uncharacterized protein YcbX